MPVSKRLRFGLVFALVFALLGPQFTRSVSTSFAAGEKIDKSLQQQATANPKKKLPVIVEMLPPAGPFSGTSGQTANGQRAKDAVNLLNKLGKDGSAAGGLPLINGAAGYANAKGLSTLSKNASVRFVHEDAIIHPRGDTGDPAGTRPPGQLSAPYPRVIKADKVWLAGPTGKDITVAVLDSGVALNDDLRLPNNRLLASVNFAGDLGGMADRGGHGTHVAGIIAGNGTRSDLSKRQQQPTLSGGAEQVEYVGVAPGANIVDVRVLNQNGYGRVSSVVRGIAWVLAHRTQYNIRVINLSLGAPARSSYLVDPMSAAIEIAWRRGIVVVASAGNGGPRQGSVESPGQNPFVITVGALDDMGTLTSADDQVAWFSAWGTPADVTQSKPDLVAPGRRIVSLRVPGSYLDSLYPDRLVTAKTGAHYLRLTGSSMATAVVSGTVALLLERQPGLTPDQVKAILKGTTQVYGQDSKTLPAHPDADGKGLVDAYAAVTSAPMLAENRGLRPSHSFARVIYPLIYGQRLVWRDPYYAGIDWNSKTWETLSWDNIAWDNIAWDNIAWDNIAWDNIAWDNIAWDNIAWDNIAWDNIAWDNIAWDNIAWDALRNLD
jgi:serine protease AprX